MEVTFDAKPVIKKTTGKLQPGDVIQNGNCIQGFWYSMVAGVERSEHNKRMMRVTIRFEHGGAGATYYGVNAGWYIVKGQSE